MAGVKVVRTPFGTPAVVDSRPNPEGGDLTLGPYVRTPGDRPGSEEHELFHAGVQGTPGGMLLDGLLGAASNVAYGPQAAYRNPTERAAYAYQEGVTGVPDEGFAGSDSPAMVAATPRGDMAMTIRNILDLLGGGAEKVGRRMGEANRKKAPK